jgi:hypothetical protein
MRKAFFLLASLSVDELYWMLKPLSVFPTTFLTNCLREEKQSTLMVPNPWEEKPT